ncbi:MAG: hypothetical protein JRI79_16190 [Deltaproteobacteria bacterium]|nr:hypothetical protein [Deltaproteobacteria bacterium]MBW2046128.1 hypothetical protein [Deltaproteobacteria bacterium]MBW2302058.1 hypothetical protein [Deltaproteobacteria bacterium]
MDSIKIISTVEEDGKLRIPPELKLEKGKVQVVITPLKDTKEREIPLFHSDHSCGKLIVGSLRRENIYDVEDSSLLTRADKKVVVR